MALGGGEGGQVLGNIGSVQLTITGDLAPLIRSLEKMRGVTKQATQQSAVDVKGVTSAIAGQTPVIGKLTGIWQQAKSLLPKGAGLGAIAGIATGLIAADLFSSLLNAVMSILGQSEVFSDIWETIGDTIGYIIDQILIAFMPAWKPFLDLFRDLAFSVMPEVIPLITELATWLSVIFKDIIAQYGPELKEAFKFLIILFAVNVAAWFLGFAIGLKIIAEIIRAFVRAIDMVLALPGLIGSAWSGVVSFFTGIFDGIVNAAKGGINAFLGGLEFVINGFIDVINAVPFAPDIGKVGLPRLYSGGLALHPTLAVVGDRPEAIVPLPYGGGMGGGLFGGASVVYITIERMEVIGGRDGAMDMLGHLQQETKFFEQRVGILR